MILHLRHIARLWRVGRTLGRYRVFERIDRTGLNITQRISLWLTTLFNPARSTAAARLGERLAMALEELGPPYIKLGQMFATRPDLIGADLAADLAGLQDDLTAFSPAQARASIVAEFGMPVEALFSSFEDKPVAAASIAQVHKATTLAGETVAVKILRPAIEQRFNRELEFFRWGAGLMESYAIKARRLRPRDVVENFARTVAREMDLRLEASSLSELSENMSGESGYVLPCVDWRRTGSRVLTISWIEGVSLTEPEALTAAGFDKKKLAARLVQIFLKQALRDGFFHADLHQGNLLVTPNGNIAAVDFGIMGRLAPGDRRFLAEILYGFIRRDYTHIAQMHFDIGFVPPQHRVEDFAAALRAIGEPIMGLSVSDISVGRLLAQLFATTEAFDMETQPRLLLLQKTMMMVEGLAYSLNPNINMWETARPVLEAWFKDNMAPEIQAADWLNEQWRLLKNAPKILAAAQKLIEAAEHPIQPAPPPLPPPPYIPRSAWLLAGLGLGLIAAWAAS